MTRQTSFQSNKKNIVINYKKEGFKKKILNGTIKKKTKLIDQVVPKVNLLEQFIGLNC